MTLITIYLSLSIPSSTGLSFILSSEFTLLFFTKCLDKTEILDSGVSLIKPKVVSHFLVSQGQDFDKEVNFHTYDQDVIWSSCF